MERERWVAVATLVGLICDVCLLTVSADVGTATSYDPPYLRKTFFFFFFFFFFFLHGLVYTRAATKCPGYTEDQLPENGLFVAAGNGVWDNGAACGRKYQLRCLSGLRRPCKDGSIVVEVVDFCRLSPCPSTFVLSNRAFDAVSKIPNTKINVEYAQYESSLRLSFLPHGEMKSRLIVTDRSASVLFFAEYDLVVNVSSSAKQQQYASQTRRRKRSFSTVISTQPSKLNIRLF
ncbi:EG45-like domain containing protein [Musa troglodytarum]|uniref:EG45-like domain containing protein n=1 Tax=Musa troglodytarum TaxID=320322 RepID=A0A9E7L6A7_9LILI|nr:EG45-like domain containing protein [Musa troglodytarum]